MALKELLTVFFFFPCQLRITGFQISAEQPDFWRSGLENWKDIYNTYIFLFKLPWEYEG